MLTRACIARIVQDLLRGEITLARAGDARLLPPGPWPDDLLVGEAGPGEAGLCADSLELLRLAGAIAEKFHIHETGIEDSLLVRTKFGDWLDLVVQSWALSARRISFRSSGSTGKPKRCTHEMADLVAEAAGHAARLQPRRVLSAVPSHHIYGFIFTVLLPLQAGCEVIDIRQSLPPACRFRPGDVIISFPDHWRFLARSMPTLPAVCGVSSTAALPADLASELRAGGLCRLVEIYGSSETSGIGWRDATDAPFYLLDGLSVMVAPRGVGVLQLAAPSHLDPGGRVIVTPDLVKMAGPDRFYVHRRIDDAVQVGGINVYPARIARALEQHPSIAQARVRLAPAEAGGRLKALVILKPGHGSAQDLRTELEEWMRTHLPPAERPRSFTFAAELPSGALGKESDWVETI